MPFVCAKLLGNLLDLQMACSLMFMTVPLLERLKAEDE